MLAGNVEPAHGPKNRVIIQRVDSATMKAFNELNKNKGQKEACFSASKTRKVHPSAVIKRMEAFKDQCDSEKLKSLIDGMITEVRKMVSGGEARAFTKQNSEKDGSKLEFICVLIYKYNCEKGEACGQCRSCTGEGCKNLLVCGSCRMCKACQKPIKCKGCKPCKTDEECEEPIPCGECKACERCQNVRSCERCKVCRKICENPVACDYVLTTYSYKEKGNPRLVRGGASTVVSGVIIGSLVLVGGICTNGVGFTIAGIIGSAVTAGGGGIGGGIAIAKGSDTNISADLNTTLEAGFIYELIKQKFATLENGHLYLELKDCEA